VYIESILVLQASERKLPVPEVRKDKRRSFLPTPKSFASAKETLPQDYKRQIVPIEHSRPPLQVGDKVCISGVKFGNLCYFGKTHIAPGVWCGIELEEPEGKHDGQVEGVRYFTCRYGHGIFAPADRVARVDAPLHDLHNEIIEEESEVIESPVENTSSHILSRPPRRLLPQPQIYVRRGSKEQVHIPSKIEEQNEEVDELDSISKSESIQASSLQVGGKASQGKKLPIIEGDQVRRISTEALDSTFSVPSSTSNLHAAQGEENPDIQVTAPNKQTSLNQNTAHGEGKASLPKPSRLPGFSKLPQPPKPDPSKSVNTQNTIEPQIDTVTDKPTSKALNSTFTICDNDLTVDSKVNGLTVETSSSDECLSGEIQECLGSDRRHFLNLTFDTEGSPPRQLLEQEANKESKTSKTLDKTYVIERKSDKSNICERKNPDIVSTLGKEETDNDGNTSLGILNLNEVDVSVSKVQNSNTSLGILDLNKSTFTCDLLQDASDVTASKSSQKDRQKFSKGTIGDKSRIASIGDGFDVEGAFTSTPLISEGFSKSRLKGNNSLSHLSSNSTQSIIRARLPSTQEEVFHVECEDGFIEEVKTNLQCTFDVNEEKEVEIVGIDALDWRQEASDEEEANDKTRSRDSEEDDVEKVHNLTHVIIKNADGSSFQNIEEGRDDSLIEKFSNLELEKGNQSQTSFSLVLQKVDKPMTDSGISELGDARIMAGSTEMFPDDDKEGREAEVTGPGGDLDRLLEHIGSHELQLQADLVAGHLKKDRPLSLYSTTSADTGYVPDTDSERGTMTANSPLDWTQKMIDSGMGQSATSIVSEGNMGQSGISMSSEPTGLDQAYIQSFKNFQSAVVRGSDRYEESDSDMYSDTGTMLADNDTVRDDSDMEQMSSLLRKVEGISVEDILPLENSKSSENTSSECTKSVDDTTKVSDVSNPKQEDSKEEKSTTTPTDGGQTSDVVEDERTEADQQQDLEIPNQKPDPGESTNQYNGRPEVANPKLNVTVDFRCKEDNSVGTENQEETTDVESIHIPSENEGESGNENDKSKEKKGKGKKFLKKRKEEKVERKKPNINVGSRLADYIKSPLPAKPKEEKENTEAAKNKRNLGYVRKLNKSEEADKGKIDGSEEKKTFKREKIEKEPPKIIKRAPPKSKWDAIMSKIEDHKTEPQPKKEVRSTLSAYLSAPSPVITKKEPEPKQKKKLPAVPTPDYSKVKSKLNLGSTPPAPKREMSPAPVKRDQSPRPKQTRAASLSTASGSAPPPLNLNDSLGSSVLGSAVESVRSTGSLSDLHTVDGERKTDGGDVSCPSTPKSLSKPANPLVSKITGRERRESMSSTVSETSQASVKVTVNKSVAQSDPQRRKSMPARSSVQRQSLSPLRTNSPARSVDSAYSRVTNRVSTNSNKVTERSKSVPAPSKRTQSQSIKKDAPPRKTTPPSTKQSNQNRNKTKTKNNQKPTQNTDVIPASIGPQAKQEITRLEALCEGRTKELNYAKIQMKSNLQAFDAMSVLVNYLANDLNAFSCPVLKSQVSTLQQELAKHKAQIEELESNKNSLEQEIVKLTETNDSTVKCLHEEHSKELSDVEQKWQEKYTLSLNDAEKRFSTSIADTINSNEKQTAEIRADHALIVQKLKLTHEEEVAALRRRQELQMEELHKQHRDKLEDITKRFESIKVGLSEKVDTLKNECDDLRHRARVSEEALLRDSDVKVQMALSPYLHLPKEIDSLKLVIEMRNEEIQKLRNRNTDMEKQVEELMIAKEKIISQKQRIENLEAIISMKTDHEKQLHDKCQMLMKKYDKESKANKRLSMDFEELVWKVNQGDTGSIENLSKLGGSPCTSETGSPVVLRRKLRSPGLNDAEKSPSKSVVYRRSISSNDGASDKKLKRRSANFLFEKERTSPTSLQSKKHTISESSSPPRSGLPLFMESPTKRGSRMAQSWNVEMHAEQKDEERLVQSCNDMDVFEAPQGLPNPPTPEEVKSSLEAAINKSQGEKTARSSNEKNSSVINPNDVNVEFSLPLNQEGVDLEEFEGEGLHIETSAETRDETSDFSHSTESNCHSDVTSGTGSMIWDYEKMDSMKSMDSSQTSQASDTLLDSNSTLVDSLKGDTMTNIKDLESEEFAQTGTSTEDKNLVKEGKSNSEVTTSPRRKVVKESTV
ncbi:hypothetical protein FSP39_007927, partial [Pinctada imbricata]